MMRSVGVATLLSLGGVVNAVDQYADMITDLPGLSWNLNFKQYSGYMNLSNGHNLHYWFVESQNDPSNDPLVIWLNGGPGCSSLDGLLLENGPFLVDHNGTLYQNDYSWNLVANVLYIESPIAVGYSYATNEEFPYQVNDNSTADDLFDGTLAFFAAFPQFNGHDLYIVGESYGGFYSPTFTHRILKAERSGETMPFNLKAFAVGNGLSNYDYNADASVWSARFHGIIDEALWDTLLKQCCRPPYDRYTCPFSSNINPVCKESYLQVVHDIYQSGLNWYNIYGDCLTTTEESNNQRIGGFSKKKYLRTMETMHRQIHNITDGKSLIWLEENVPCIDSTGTDIYLNRDDVRSAIHIADDTPLDWTICASRDDMNYTTLYDNMAGIYNDIFNWDPSIYATVYTGDVDLSVPGLHSEWFIDDLFGATDTTHRYRTWMLDDDDQIAGWTKDWDRLHYVTVRGSGHMVPQYRPVQALKMFKYFLANKPL